MSSEQLSTFEDMRFEASAALGDVEDVLHSDWRPGTGPRPRRRRP